MLRFLPASNNETDPCLLLGNWLIAAFGMPQERKIALLLDGQPAGQLFAKCTFLPAGKLSFVCEGGRGLRETSAAGRMDPYVIFKADGQVSACVRVAVQRAGRRSKCRQNRRFGQQYPDMSPLLDPVFQRTPQRFLGNTTVKRARRSSEGSASKKETRVSSKHCRGGVRSVWCASTAT